MPDQNVLKWKQEGQAYFWRYLDNTRNYPGWHFTADTKGCKSILSLLSLMQNAGYPSRREIRMVEPTKEVLSVPNNWDGEARWVAATRLRLIYPKQSVSSDYWELTAIGNEVTLRVGAQRLLELYKGVKDVLNGEGDYAVGEETGDLLIWFWWFLNG